MSTRPLIMFVDDEPHNLAVFEAAMPEGWDIRVFESPLTAIEQVEALKPNVIVSDQRMPGMKGVKFLELASKLNPQSVRILVTGYSDEDLIIESVRAAKIFDYIRKPWDVDELVKRLEAAIDFNSITIQKESLASELRARDAELRERNAELLGKTLELERSLQQLQETSRELQCWVPPAVSAMAKSKTIFPIKRDLALLAIDVIGSGAIHGITVGQRSLRSLALEEFSVLVLKHGGYIENTEGDAAYANFGLTESTSHPCDAALAVANEFRAALRGIAIHHHQSIETGIGLHFGVQVEANISICTVNTPTGQIIQKRFYTMSPDIDLVHRMEKHVHKLAGSNIILSKAFCDQLTRPSDKPVIPIGRHQFKGQSKDVDLFLIKSSVATEDEINQVKNLEAG